MSEIKTIQEGKQFLRDNFRQGAKCPCCGQMVKCYRYKLYATSARALIELYKLDQRNPEVGYFHVSEYAEAKNGQPRAPHFAELRFWGLIERMPHDGNPHKKSLGFWAITHKGRQFVRKEQKLWAKILVYNNTFQGFDESAGTVGIDEALGNGFDYQELMTS